MSAFIFKIVESKEELQAVKQLRQDVFVIEQEIPGEDDKDGRDESSIHLIVKKEGKAVATGRLTPEGESRALISRIAVVKTARGQGLGKKIIQVLEDLAKQNSIDSLYLDPHDHLEKFYQSLGYKKESGWSRKVARHQLIRMHKKI